MEQEQEGNKLIAEFMGASFNPEYPTIIYHVVKGESFRYISDLKYHSSWDWLHGVIEKIHDECKLYPEGLMFAAGLTIFSTKKQVWLAVVEFIKWYNQNK